MTKPSLAEDADLAAVRFPCIAQSKVDGVRALNLEGTLTGRSLDAFPGHGITEFFSKPEYLGFDGEMVLGHNPAAQALCRLTTGAMGRFKGVTEMPDLTWWVFDLVLPDTLHLTYTARYGLLRERVINDRPARVKLMPYMRAVSPETLQAFIAMNAQAGFEGTIIRNPYAPYKEGRATKKSQELWRVKSWADAEIHVTGITEGQMNGNAAKTNTLGRTERSSAKAGMVPNGQVGSIQGTLLADILDPVSGALLFAKGLPITVGSGEMSVKEATHYFAYPDEIVGHIVKFKFMTHGGKDLPRFPTYISHRLLADIS